MAADTFWTQGQQMDPKRQYRFVASFTGLNTSGCSFFVKSVDKPSLSISEASHNYLNHTFYYPGRVSWNTISVTLVDPVQPDATATLMQAIKLAGYDIPANATELGTLSKSKSITSIGTITITQVDAEGDELESWTLNNPWIKSVTLSGLDYSGDALSEATLEIRYDWATLTKHGETTNTGGALSSDATIF